MSRIDNDLFTYEVEIPGLANIPSLKFYNHKTIDHYTKNALWIYWTRGGDEVELTDKESSNSDDEDDVAKIFRIDGVVFDFETPTWKDDGYCNRGSLPRAYIVGNTLHYQDSEWYEALEDGELKDEALKNKTVMDGIINEDDESHHEVWRRWDGYENAIHDHEEITNEDEHGNTERCELFDNPHHESPICDISRFEMIKY
nr:hypothetical protein [Tanacetum cinerariifolium]